MDAEGISMDEFKQAFQKGNEFASGTGKSTRSMAYHFHGQQRITAVNYGASTIIAKSGDTVDQGDGTDVEVADQYRVVSDQSLAKGLLIGERVLSVKVLNHADARPWHLQELLTSNGSWRIIVFAGDVTAPQQREKLERIGKALQEPDSFLRKFAAPGNEIDTTFEVLCIHRAPRTAVTVF